MIKVRRSHDGALVEIGPDGSERPYDRAAVDWSKLDRLTDEDLTARARSDPDNPPLGEAAEALFPLPNVAQLRGRLRMSQAEFARTFRLPLRTLQEWEQHRRVPDQAAIAYLLVIERDPEAVRRALAA